MSCLPGSHNIDIANIITDKLILGTLKPSNCQPEAAPRGGLGRTCPPQYFSGPIFQFVEIRGEIFWGGGTMVAQEKNSSTDKLGNEKDFCQ